jgi:hypothetical protein
MATSKKRNDVLVAMYETMTVKQLKNAVKDLSQKTNKPVPGYYKLKKGDLINLLIDMHTNYIPSKKSSNGPSRAGSPSSRRSKSPKEDLNKKTVKELKDMLRGRGLPVSGKKADLIKRLS